MFFAFVLSTYSSSFCSGDKPLKDYITSLGTNCVSDCSIFENAYQKQDECRCKPGYDRKNNACQLSSNSCEDPDLVRALGSRVDCVSKDSCLAMGNTIIVGTQCVCSDGYEIYKNPGSSTAAGCQASIFPCAEGKVLDLERSTCIPKEQCTSLQYTHTSLGLCNCDNDHRTISGQSNCVPKCYVSSSKNYISPDFTKCISFQECGNYQRFSTKTLGDYALCECAVNTTLNEEKTECVGEEGPFTVSAVVKSEDYTPIVIGVLLGAVALIIIVVVVLYLNKRKSQSSTDPELIQLMNTN